ncbi:DUF2252 family protein [Streptomyces sp. SM11]|uniref:DUF2252 family protein n=1 Tax=Streptomyces sp. SM11 TaxID=565557 RepID=UPI0035BC11FA
MAAGLIIAGHAESLPSGWRGPPEDFALVDVARKAVGVGGAGTRCWIILLLDRDGERVASGRPPADGWAGHAGGAANGPPGPGG